MQITVITPDGCLPGELLCVDVGDGRSLEVVVPEHCYSGVPILVQVDGDDDGAESGQGVVAPAMELVEVTVPFGVAVGDTFSVTTGWGETFDITLPHGFAAGSTLTCELPLPQIDEELPHSPLRSPSPIASPHKRRQARVSREARASREVPAENVSMSRRPSREPWDGGASDDETLTQRGGGSPIPTAGFGGRSRRATVLEADLDVASLQAAADPGHRYGPGARVQCLRSNGSYTAGTVVTSFEGVFDVLYTIRLENGLVKQAVPEDELYSADDADDPGYGEHLNAALLAAMEAESFDDECCGMMACDGDYD